MSIEDRIYPMLRSYISAPQWVKYVTGYCYRVLPRALRLGYRYEYFDRVRRIAGKSETAAYAQQRLEEILAWAMNTVPAYARFRDMAGSGLSPMEMLGKLPFTSKAEIKANGTRYLANGMPPRKVLPMYTGGSTAEPMRFALEKATTRTKEYAFIRDFEERVGRADDVLTLSLRGRTVPSASRCGGALCMFEPINRKLIVSSDHLVEQYMPGYADAIARWRPTFIEAFPSALYPLARWLEANPRPAIKARIRGVMLYSENVFDYQLALFRRVFDCPIVKHYGHSERVLMAASMPDDDRYFFWPQYGWMELVDSRGQAVTVPGMVGEIVGTSFDNRVMPFVRYRTGDLGILGEGEHPLLPGYPVLTRIEGRLQEFLVCRDNRLVSVTTLGSAHFQDLWKAESIQFEQFEPGFATLRVVAAPGSLSEDDWRAVEQAVENKTQQGCRVRVERVDRIPRTPRGKHRMLIQHLDLSGHFGASQDCDKANEEDPDARHQS